MIHGTMGKTTGILGGSMSTVKIHISALFLFPLLKSVLMFHVSNAPVKFFYEAPLSLVHL